MNALALQSFGYGDQLVRAVERDGMAWFVANDVCAVLEINNSRQAVSRLEEDERDCVTTDDAMGRPRETTVVSESGVYALIFRSRKPAARAFRKWVTSEVLPAIREHGRYEPDAANDGGPVRIELPETPDEFERVRVRLQLVREARIAFGARAARRAWVMAGLPDLSEADPLLEHDPTLRDRYPGLAAWYEERVVRREGSRTSARVFFSDYERWCSTNEVPLDQRYTETAFGRFLTACGHPASRDARGRRQRRGIALAD